MGKTILIVEDEQNIVDILSFNLSREGYDTLEAYDGKTGLQLALEQNPDLILLDLMLPEMNGFDVCRKLREAGSSVPILMLTAREEETDKVLGLELGADDYITKPFAMRELMAPGEGEHPPGGYGSGPERPARRRNGETAGAGTGLHRSGRGHRVQGQKAPGPDPAGV